MYCEYCGKDLGENGICDCQVINESLDKDTATEVTEKESSIQITTKEPIKLKKTKIIVIAAVILVALVALVVVFGGGKDKPSEIHNTKDVKEFVEKGFDWEGYDKVIVHDMYYREKKTSDKEQTESYSGDYKKAISATCVATNEEGKEKHLLINFEVDSINKDDSSFDLGDGLYYIEYDTKDELEADLRDDEYNEVELLEEGDALNTDLMAYSEFGKAVIMQDDEVYKEFVQHAKSVLKNYEDSLNELSLEDGYAKYEFETILYIEDANSDYFVLDIIFSDTNDSTKQSFTLVEYSHNPTDEDLDGLKINDAGKLVVPEVANIYGGISMAHLAGDYLPAIKSGCEYMGYMITEPYIITFEE